MPNHPHFQTPSVTLRPATPDDALALARLAQLDSAEVPTGEVLLAVVDGVPLAALAVATGTVVADPFSRTAEFVDLLRDRAERLRAADERRGAGRHDRRPRGSVRWPALLRH